MKMVVESNNTFINKEDNRGMNLLANFHGLRGTDYFRHRAALLLNTLRSHFQKRNLKAFPTYPIVRRGGRR